MEYKRDVYQEIYKKEFIVDFNHGPMAKGQIKHLEIEQLIDLMNQKASKFVDAVMFVKETIVYELEGGACSAIALQIAQSMVKYFQFFANGAPLQYLKSLVEEIDHSSSQGKQTIRNIQEAFNNIWVNKENRGKQDISQQKIKALAAFFDMHVVDSTNDIVLEETINCQQKFEHQVENLSAGVYLLRVIQPMENYKCEKHGHSTILIKMGEGKQWYFDVELGLYDLTDSKGFLYHSLCSLQKKFNVNVCKFYKLENISLKERILMNFQSQSIQSGQFPEEEIEKVSKYLDNALFFEMKNNKKFADELRDFWINVISTDSPPPSVPSLIGKVENRKNIKIKAIPLPSSSKRTFLIEKLTGQYGVGVRRYYIEDSSRNEFSLSHGVDLTRRLEIDVHYPIIKQTEGQFQVLSKLKDNRIIDSDFMTHSQPGSEPVEGEKKFPILIFSPSFGSSPSDYQYLIEEASSQGNCVISINHPYSCAFSRFLGCQHYQLPRFSFDKEEDMQKIVQEDSIRAEDIKFIIEQIKKKKIKDFDNIFGNIVNDNLIGVFGHSLGGSAALHACSLTSDIKAAINIDGRIMHPTSKIAQDVLVITGKLTLSKEFEEAFKYFKENHTTKSVDRKNLNVEHSDFSCAFYRSNKKVNIIKKEIEKKLPILKDTQKWVIQFFKEKFKN